MCTMRTEAERSTILGQDQSEWPEIAIIILNWNSYEDTADCLESIKEVEYPNYQAIVVDNASTDRSIDRLKNDYPWCEFVTNDSNLGYAKGINQGISVATERDFDYILLLNNDTTVDSGFLKPLVKTSTECGEYCIVSGIIKYKNTNKIQSAGRRINQYLMSAPHLKSVIRDSEYQVDCVSGALILISSKFLSEIGGLNESYFLGPDDIDLCLQAQKHGGEVIINPDSVIYHNPGSSGGTGNAFRYYHSTKGRLNLANRYLPSSKRILFYMVFYASRIIRIGQWTVQREYDLIWATILGMYDFTTRNLRKKRLEILR